MIRLAPPISIAPLLKKPSQSWNYDPTAWNWIQGQNGQCLTPMLNQIKFSNGQVISSAKTTNTGFQTLKRWWADLMGVSA